MNDDVKVYVCRKCGLDTAYSGVTVFEAKRFHERVCQDSSPKPFDETKEVRDSKGGVWWRKDDKYTNGLYECTVEDMRAAYETGGEVKATLRG